MCRSLPPGACVTTSSDPQVRFDPKRLTRSFAYQCSSKPNEVRLEAACKTSGCFPPQARPFARSFRRHTALRPCSRCSSTSFYTHFQIEWCLTYSTGRLVDHSFRTDGALPTKWCMVRDGNHDVLYSQFAPQCISHSSWVSLSLYSCSHGSNRANRHAHRAHGPALEVRFSFEDQVVCLRLQRCR